MLFWLDLYRHCYAADYVLSYGFLAWFKSLSGFALLFLSPVIAELFIATIYAPDILFFALTFLARLPLQLKFH